MDEARSHTELAGDGGQAAIARPEGGLGAEERGGEQVNIDIADASAEERVNFDQAHRLGVAGHRGGR